MISENFENFFENLTTGYDPSDDFTSEPANVSEWRRLRSELFSSKFIRDVDYNYAHAQYYATHAARVNQSLDIMSLLSWPRLLNPIHHIQDLAWHQSYRFEFSHEFGYLRLSDAARKKVVFITFYRTKNNTFIYIFP